MHMNRLFSFPRHLIDELNNKIPRGHRSHYVSEALKEKLYPEEGKHLVKDASGMGLLAAAIHKDDVPDYLKVMIKKELGITV